MQLLHLFLLLGCPIFLATDVERSAPSLTKCTPGRKKASNGDCIELEDADVMRAMNMLAHPPPTTCKNVTIIQGIGVCEDDLPQDCLIWSVLSTSWCNEVGSLEFEKYWSQRCHVKLFHYTAYFKGIFHHCVTTRTLASAYSRSFPTL